MRKNIFIVLLAVIAGAAFSGCSKNNSSAPSTGSVMFVNGCAGSQNVNLSINGTKLNAASNLAFLKTSGYQSAKAASDAFSFSLTATGTPLTSATEAVTAGQSYSVFTGGLVTAPTFVFVSDDLTSPASGMAKIRFVNLSSDTLNLSCYIGSTNIASNVAMSSVTSFFSINATSGVNVLLQDPNKPTELAQLAGQTFSAGQIYTIMLTGTETGTSTSALTVTVINN